MSAAVCHRSRDPQAIQWWHMSYWLLKKKKQKNTFDCIVLWNSFCVHLRGAHNLPGIQDGGSLSTYLFCALPLWFLILHSCSFWSTKVSRAAEEYQILQWLSNASEFPTESILRRLFNYCINWSLLLQPTVILESPFLKLKKILQRYFICKYNNRGKITSTPESYFKTLCKVCELQAIHNLITLHYIQS